MLSISQHFFSPRSAELQNAIGTENYAAAAELRDKISKLEAESLAESAKALAYDKIRYAFRLGQKVRHKIFGMLTNLIQSFGFVSSFQMV